MWLASSIASTMSPSPRAFSLPATATLPPSSSTSTSDTPRPTTIPCPFVPRSGRRGPRLFP
eukprot:4896065-Alexandrium_andersonii.AAC.1